MPPPSGYCVRMRDAEFTLKRITLWTNDALFNHAVGAALRLQAVANHLSDELDAEEAINDQSGYQPCEAPLASGGMSAIGRENLVRSIQQKLPLCQIKANALRMSLAARRELMRQCLRVVNY